MIREMTGLPELQEFILVFGQGTRPVELPSGVCTSESKPTRARDRIYGQVVAIESKLRERDIYDIQVDDPRGQEVPGFVRRLIN